MRRIQVLICKCGSKYAACVEDENNDEALRSIYWCPYCLAMLEEECCCYSDDGDF